MSPKAKIVDPLQVYDNINLGRRIDPIWPNEEWRLKGGRNSWKDWLPEEDMEGAVQSTPNITLADSCELEDIPELDTLDNIFTEIGKFDAMLDELGSVNSYLTDLQSNLERLTGNQASEHNETSWSGVSNWEDMYVNSDEEEDS